jgi:hypothetical protein
MRLHQLQPLVAMKLEYALAFVSVAQPRLLCGCELPLFQGFEIAVLHDALSFAALDRAKAGRPPTMVL